MEIVAIVLLALVVAALALLLIPFDVFVEASKAGPSQRGGVTIRWLGIALWRSKPRQDEVPRRQGTETEVDVVRLLRILRLLRDSSSTLVGIARSVRRAVSVRRVSVDVTFGLGDPADTAVAAGYLWAVAWVLNLSPVVSISARPDMERLRLDGSVMAQLRVRMLPLVVGFLRAYSHRTFRMLVKEVRG